YPALEAAQKLNATTGLSVGVVNMRFVKPLDEELLRQVAAKTPKLITVEDHVVMGGFGSAVLEALAAGVGRYQILRLGLPDHFIEHGAPALLYDQVGLSSDKIAARIADWMNV